MSSEKQGLTSEAPPPYDDFSGSPGGEKQAPSLSVAPYPANAAYPLGPQPSAAPYPPAAAVNPGYPGYTAGPTVVVAAQPGVASTSYQARPENYLALSIFSIFCCCWVFGLVALIHSMQVDSAWNSGDLVGANRASQSAKSWNKAAIITGVIISVITFVLVVVGNVVPRVILSTS